MAKVTHYEIDGAKKIVFADIQRAKEKELKVISNYLAIGFTLVEKEFKTVKKSKEEIESNPFSKDNVVAFLKTQDAKFLKEYEELFNAPVSNGATYKKDCKSGKKGEIKKKGHINTLKWFKETFPEYPDNKKQ